MYKVSFCIPAYNNKEIILRMVSSLLSNDNGFFQVVISDNASDDGTYRELEKINDLRLKLSCNDSNIGAKQNWLKSLELGDGEWLYLVMGRDVLDSSKIENLISLLEEAKRSDVGCFLDRKGTGRLDILNVEDAIIPFLALDHPTGLVIRREYFEKVEDKDEIFNLDTVYPELILKAKLLRLSKGAIGYSGLYVNKHYLNKYNQYSTFAQYNVIEDCFIYPTNRIKDIILVIKTAQDMKGCVSEEKFDLFFQKKLDEITNFIMGWRVLCTRVDQMKHYGFDKRMVIKDELLGFIQLLQDMILENIDLSSREESILDSKCDEARKSINEELFERVAYGESVNSLLLQKCLKICSSSEIRKELESHGYKRVAIYGYGDIGKSMAILLKNSGIEVDYYIDKRKNVYDSIPILSPIDELPQTDAIIITPLLYIDEIKKELSMHTSIDLISVEELIYSI